MHPTRSRARTVRRALAALASSAAALAATTSAANAAPPPVIQSPAAPSSSEVVTPTTQSVDLTGVVAPATRGATGVTGAEAQAQAAAAGAEAVAGQSTGEVKVQRFGMVAASWLPDPGRSGRRRRGPHPHGGHLVRVDLARGPRRRQWQGHPNGHGPGVGGGGR